MYNPDFISNPGAAVSSVTAGEYCLENDEKIQIIWITAIITKV